MCNDYCFTGPYLVDLLGHAGVLTGFGQQAGDVQISLPPCLVVNFSLHGGKARRVVHQSLQPLRLAFGQDSSRSICHGGW